MTAGRVTSGREPLCVTAQAGNGLFIVNDGTNAIDLFRR
jgi:hypothetical protein